MELQDRARAVGQRWDYRRRAKDPGRLLAAASYDTSARPFRDPSRRRYGAGIFCHSHGKSRLAVGWDRLFGSHDRNGVA